MDTNSSSPQNNVVSYATGNLELSKDEFGTQADSTQFLLPRLAWSSQLAYLRVIFRAKKALDRIEQEAKSLKDF